MVRVGSTIDIYVLRYYDESSADLLFRASSIDNAIITGTRKALNLKYKGFKILDKNYCEIFHGGLANY